VSSGIDATVLREPAANSTPNERLASTRSPTVDVGASVTGMKIVFTSWLIGIAVGLIYMLGIGLSGR
jgi:hypothetical protein